MKRGGKREDKGNGGDREERALLRFKDNFLRWIKFFPLFNFDGCGKTYFASYRLPNPRESFLILGF